MAPSEPALSSIDFFRDVGAALKSRAGHPIIRERLLYISTPLKDATDADNAQLRNEHGIKTLVEYGVSRRIRVFPDDFPDSSPPEPEYKMIKFGLVKVIGIQYCWSSLTPYPYVVALRKRLSLLKKAKNIHYAITDKEKNIQDIYQEAMVERGMFNHAFDRLEHAQAEIRELFNRVLSQRTSYPVLLSGLSLGNDPGLVLLLIFLLLALPIVFIDEDDLYPLDVVEKPDKENLPMIERFREDLRQNRAAWAKAVRDHLDSKYGGAEAYLESTGVTAASRDAVKHIFLDGNAENLIGL